MSESLGSQLTAWVDEFITQPVEEMSREVAEMFFTCMTMDATTLEYPPIEEPFILKVGKSRAKHLGLDITPSTMLFLSVGLTRSPGSLIMYLTALRHLQLGSVSSTLRNGKLQNGRLTMETLAYTFPNGFLTEAAMSSMWDKQKIKHGSHYANLVDVVQPSDFSLEVSNVG